MLTCGPPAVGFGLPGMVVLPGGTVPGVPGIVVPGMGLSGIVVLGGVAGGGVPGVRSLRGIVVVGGTVLGGMSLCGGMVSVPPGMVDPGGTFGPGVSPGIGAVEDGGVAGPPAGGISCACAAKARADAAPQANKVEKRMKASSLDDSYSGG